MTRWDYFPMDRGPCAPAVDVQGGWQITSYFGGRIDPITGVAGTHGGQDLAFYGCRGAAIYAPSAGTLAQGWDTSGGGNWSGITLDDGSYIGIGHASSFAPGASYRRVAAGEHIAWCDSTGSSTGDHVHIAYRPTGSTSYADPWPLLDDAQHRIVGEDDEMTDDDFNRIAGLISSIVEDKIHRYLTPSHLLFDSECQWRINDQLERVPVRTPGLSGLLRETSLAANQVIVKAGQAAPDAVNIEALPADQQDAFYALPIAEGY